MYLGRRSLFSLCVNISEILNTGIAMYFLNKTGKNYTAKAFDKSTINKSPTSELHLIENLSAITNIGKNSVFDTDLCFQEDCSTLTFEGELVFSKIETSQIDGLDRGYTLYKMDGNGWVWHDVYYKNIFISRSLHLLNNHLSGFYTAVEPEDPKNILSIIRRHDSYMEFNDFIINESFGNNQTLEVMNDPEKHVLFDTDWNRNQRGTFGFQLVIEEKTHIIDKNTFRNKHTAYCPNLGKLTQFSVNDAEQYPVNFNVGLIDGFLFIDDLVEKNPFTLLCPNTFLKSDLDYRLNQAKSLGQKTILLSGTNKDGFGVQALISIIDIDYGVENCFTVERLILTPEPFIQANVLFSEENM